MQHLILGILLSLLGLWGIVSHWYQFVDLIWVLVPMLLLVLGIMSVLSGINSYKRSV